MSYSAYYTPDGWVFIKIQAVGYTKSLIKVFGSWSGGYLNGDSWRVNSGCTKIEENENEYIVSGYSGSQYILSKTRNYIRPSNKAILDDMIAELRSYGHCAEIISVEEAIELVPQPTQEQKIEHNSKRRKDNFEASSRLDWKDVRLAAEGGNKSMIKYLSSELKMR